MTDYCKRCFKRLELTSEVDHCTRCQNIVNNENMLKECGCCKECREA